ncbi:MAG: hypothetical protein WBO10_07980 [Pyrinomonadaceae bacterium]
MRRKILAVVVALITAFAVMMIVEMMNSFIVPMPGKEITDDPARLREFMATLPTTAYVVVLIGYFLASFTGGFIVKNMSRRESPGMSLPILIGAILTIGAVLNMFVLLPGQPVWFAILALLTFIPVSLLGAKLAGK